MAPAVERALRGHGLTVRRVGHARPRPRPRAGRARRRRAGETVVALSGDGMVGVVADALRDFPARCWA